MQGSRHGAAEALAVLPGMGKSSANALAQNFAARFRPPPESAFRKALLRQPVPLPVIAEQTDRSSPPASKNENTAADRVLRKPLLAHANKRVYALPFLQCTAKKEICAVHKYAE